MSQQRLDRILMSAADGEEQRRVAGFGFRFNVGAELDEQLGGGGVPFRSGPHERRLAFRRLLDIHLRAMPQQQFDGIHFSGERRCHERSLARFRRAVGVGARLQEELDQGGVPIRACERKRGDVVTGGGGYIGSGGDQEVGDFQIVVTHRLMERGEAIGSRRCHRHVLREQPADRLGVLISGRFDQTQVGGGCRECARQQNKARCNS